jgi:hypothetical protein
MIHTFGAIVGVTTALIGAAALPTTTPAESGLRLIVVSHRTVGAMRVPVNPTRNTIDCPEPHSCDPGDPALNKRQDAERKKLKGEV